MRDATRMNGSCHLERTAFVRRIVRCSNIECDRWSIFEALRCDGRRQFKFKAQAVSGLATPSQPGIELVHPWGAAHSSSRLVQLAIVRTVFPTRLPLQNAPHSTADTVRQSWSYPSMPLDSRPASHPSIKHPVHIHGTQAVSHGRPV